MNYDCGNTPFCHKIATWREVAQSGSMLRNIFCGSMWLYVANFDSHIRDTLRYLKPSGAKWRNVAENFFFHAPHFATWRQYLNYNVTQCVANMWTIIRHNKQYWTTKNVAQSATPSGSTWCHIFCGLILVIVANYGSHICATLRQIVVQVQVVPYWASLSQSAILWQMEYSHSRYVN